MSVLNKKQNKLKYECLKYCLVLLCQIAVLLDEQNLAFWYTYTNSQLQFSAGSCISHDVSLKLQYARYCNMYGWCCSKHAVWEERY